MNFQYCQYKVFLITILDMVLQNLIFSVISLLANKRQIFQKLSDNQVYDMCKTWDVLVFLIILNTDININVLKQLFDNSFVWCIIYGDTEQILTQVEIYNHINDIIAKILLCIELFERMECQETIMQLEFYINPIHSNYYHYISPKFICNVQNNFFKEWNNICTLWRGHYLDIESCF